MSAVIACPSKGGGQTPEKISVTPNAVGFKSTQIGLLVRACKAKLQGCGLESHHCQLFPMPHTKPKTKNSIYCTGNDVSCDRCVCVFNLASGVPKRLSITQYQLQRSGFGTPRHCVY
jgi:hypothetical protein